jgi:parallel beta-helix repeat protein
VLREELKLRRKIILGMMLTLLILSMLTFAFNIQPVISEPATIVVPYDYPTIQEAINAANPGDTIYVCSGIYHENVVINKTLTLMGESRSNTIINGSGLNYTGALVVIVVDNVDMSEFTVTNASHQGIEVEERQYCEVHDNIVCFTGERGIAFRSADNNKAYNNVVHNSSAYGGIEAIHGNNNTIYSNIAYFNAWGIATNHGSYNHIYNNKVHSNREAGIHIDWPSTDNIIYNNDVSSNTNDGIRVINQANRTEIFGNTISENDCGIFLEDSYASNISGNYIMNNAGGVTLVSSENNTFYHNNFIGNGWQVYIQPSRFNIWDYGYPSGGNYWSDYTGLDLYSGRYQNETGSDGIGDVPYTIDANNTDKYPLMRTHYYEDRMTQVVSTESTDDSYYPSLAVDSSGNIHIAWHDQTDYGDSGTDNDIFYKKYVPDNGWTTTEVVSTESTDDSYYPSLAVDSSGNIHIAWQEWNTTSISYDVFYKRYEVGVGWTTTELVSTESTGDSHQPSLAVDVGGNVHIAWYDNTDYNDSGTDYDVFYKRYEVGVGWTSTEVISIQSTDYSFLPSLAVDVGGNVHIAWYDYDDIAGSGTDYDVFYKRYEVGVGWTSAELVSTESTGDSYYPSLAVDSGGNVHVAWYDGTIYDGSGIDDDIFYKRYEVGVGWTTTEVVSMESTGYSYWPSLAVDSGGNVHIAWTDYTDYAGSGTDYDVFYKRYEVGVGWTTTEVVSTESTATSWNPSLAVDLAGNIHVAWEDDTDYAGFGSDADIFYKYVRVHSTQYPWPMFRHNPRHTGYTESPAPNTNQTQWTYTTGDGVWSSPAVVDGMVFVGSNDGNVYALDQHTGAHIWNYTTGDAVMASPAVAGGKVYVGSNDSKVYALDQYTGAHVWNYTTGDWITSSPTVTYGKVFVGSFDGKVYCLDAATGAHIWNYTTGGLGWSSPAVAGGKVYIGSGDGKVYCLDDATGAHVWNYTTGDWITSSPTVVDGMVFVGSNDGNVYALDQHTGAHIWNYTTGDRVYSSPAVADGKVYVGSRDNKTYCLDASTGTFIWNYTTGGLGWSSPAVADGEVYIGSKDNKVCCLEAATGAHIWSYATGDCVESSPAVADGMVFVGSYDHVVYAFGNVIRVPEDYPTIQNAIDTADPGATIMVAPGVYHESLVINKPVTIIGRTGSGPIHEGGGSGIAVIITDTSEVTIVNFVITNWDQGMLIDNSSSCKIYGNIFQQNDIAVNLTESSITNTIYWNNFIDNSIQVITETSMNIWDNGYPDGGNYWSTHISEDQCSGPNQNEPGSDGISDTQYTIVGNNIDRYPLVKPFSAHDIGITSITTSKTIVCQGYELSITAKILNYGINTETFTITVHAYTIVITQTQITLKSRDSTGFTFTLNTAGVAKGNYIISATAEPVPGETDTTDNIAEAADTVLVTVSGDVSGDRICDMLDISMLIDKFMTTPSDPRWHSNCDVNCDLSIDMADISIAIDHFMEEW